MRRTNVPSVQTQLASAVAAPRPITVESERAAFRQQSALSPEIREQERLQSF
jgi:hypothetical protein